MGLIEMAKRLKDVHPDYIMMFKSGTFYKVFGKDAYILGAMFNYNIHVVNENVTTCGFQINAEKKVRAKLEESKINYKIIDPRNEYNVDVSEEFNNLNNYEKEFNKDFTIIKQKKKVDRISEELLLYVAKPNFKEIIRKIEDILDETREI